MISNLKRRLIIPIITLVVLSASCLFVFADDSYVFDYSFPSDIWSGFSSPSYPNLFPLCCNYNANSGSYSFYCLASAPASPLFLNAVGNRFNIYYDPSFSTSFSDNIYLVSFVNSVYGSPSRIGNQNYVPLNFGAGTTVSLLSSSSLLSFYNEGVPIVGGGSPDLLISNFETDIPPGTALVLEYYGLSPDRMTLTATFSEKFNAKSATHGQIINWGSGSMFVFSDVDLHDDTWQIPWEVVDPDIFRSSRNGRYVVNTFGETSFCCIINPVNNWDMDYQGNPYEANPSVHVYIEGDINHAYTYSLNQTYAKVITATDSGLVWDENIHKWHPFENNGVSDTLAPSDVSVDSSVEYDSNASMAVQAGYGATGINVNGTGDIFARSAKNLQEAYSNHNGFVNALAQWLSVFPPEIWTVLLTTALVLCALALIRAIL